MKKDDKDDVLDIAKIIADNKNDPFYNKVNEGLKELVKRDKEIFYEKILSSIERSLMNVIPEDPEYDLYLQAWLIYHRCCDNFDNLHFPPDGFPKTPNDRKIMNNNVREANKQMSDFLNGKVSALSRDERKWQNAKLEALRIVEREK